MPVWLLLILLAFTPAGAGLAGWATRVGQAWLPSMGALAALVVFTGAVTALWEIAWLPATWYLSVRVDGRQGRRSGVVEVVGAQAQAWLGATVAALLAAAGVQAAVLVAGRWWWAAAGALVAAGLAAAMHLVPALVARWSGARPVRGPRSSSGSARSHGRVRVPIASIDELPDSADGDRHGAGGRRGQRPGASSLPMSSCATGATKRLRWWWRAT